MFVRVRDPGTGHQFDIPENHPALTRGPLVRLDAKRWPPSEVPRAPKHNIRLAGRSASRESAADTPVTEEATQKEN